MTAHSRTDAMPPLALLAGGLASRLGSLTARVPKSLLSVAGEPFIAHQLRFLATQNIHDVVICCGHLGEQIEAFVGDGSRFSCRVRYSSDGLFLRGTGGAIRNALPLLGPHFWVMYGDSYLTAPFAPILEAFLNSASPAMMTVFRNEDRWDRSNVHYAAGRILGYDKRHPQPEMRHIDYGLSFFSAETFNPWPDRAAFDLSDLQSRLAEEGALAGYEVAERFYEIGSVSGLEETGAFLAARRTLPPPAEMKPGHRASGASA